MCPREFLSKMLDSFSRWSFLCAVRHEMATDQVRIESLYARLYRTIIGFGLLIAAAWLFAVFSYYLSRKTGSDWFSRSGSVMALVGAAVTFRLVNFYQRGRAAALIGCYGKSVLKSTGCRRTSLFLISWQRAV